MSSTECLYEEHLERVMSIMREHNGPMTCKDIMDRWTLYKWEKMSQSDMEMLLFELLRVNKVTCKSIFNIPSQKLYWVKGKATKGKKAGKQDRITRLKEEVEALENQPSTKELMISVQTLEKERDSLVLRLWKNSDGGDDGGDMEEEPFIIDHLLGKHMKYYTSCTEQKRTEADKIVVELQAAKRAQTTRAKELKLLADKLLDMLSRTTGTPKDQILQCFGINQKVNT